MKTIGTEEHCVTDEVVAAWQALDASDEDAGTGADAPQLREKLLEVGPERIAAMDAAGLDVQVLSLCPPGLGTLAPDVADALAVATNDRLAAIVASRPDRFQAFAALAMSAPATAGVELERAVRSLGMAGAMVYGRTRERNLDHADNWAIFEAAAELRAPLYIHPQIPQGPVRRALYGGFGDPIDHVFATNGLGWHYESGVQFLRMALAGVFDRFPELQVVLGHWGEVVLFFLERADNLAAAAGLERSFSEYARHNAYVTAGGIYSERYLRWAIEVVGVERVMFASDYPYRPRPAGGVVAFLGRAGLSGAEVEAVAGGNWERLVGAIRR